MDLFIFSGNTCNDLESFLVNGAAPGCTLLGQDVDGVRKPAVVNFTAAASRTPASSCSTSGPATNPESCRSRSRARSVGRRMLRRPPPPTQVGGHSQADHHQADTGLQRLGDQRVHDEHERPADEQEGHPGIAPRPVGSRQRPAACGAAPSRRRRWRRGTGTARTRRRCRAARSCPRTSVRSPTRPAPAGRRPATRERGWTPPATGRRARPGPSAGRCARRRGWSTERHPKVETTTAAEMSRAPHGPNSDRGRRLADALRVGHGLGRQHAHVEQVHEEVERRDRDRPADEAPRDGALRVARLPGQRSVKPYQPS